MDEGRYCGAEPPEGSGQLRTARCVVYLPEGKPSASHIHRIMGTGFKWKDED